MQKSKGTWEAAKEATTEAERKGAEAHLKSCEAEHLLSQATELTQAAANARAKESEVRTGFLVFDASCSCWSNRAFAGRCTAACIQALRPG